MYQLAEEASKVRFLFKNAALRQIDVQFDNVRLGRCAIFSSIESRDVNGLQHHIITNYP